MATALRVSSRFFCDAHLWCQVSRTLLQYFQRYRLFSIFHFWVANRMTSSLHNRKMSISLKRKKIFQKEKRHSSVFWKAFQISTKNFSFHRHFKLNSNIHSRQTRYCNFNLTYPRYNRETERGRTFTVTTCKAWNSLSFPVRQRDSVDSLKKALWNEFFKQQQNLDHFSL